MGTQESAMVNAYPARFMPIWLVGGLSGNFAEIRDENFKQPPPGTQGIVDTPVRQELRRIGRNLGAVNGSVSRRSSHVDRSISPLSFRPGCQPLPAGRPGLR